MTIQGFVQGVGFRPFVYRLAKSLALKGYVKNNTRGVEISVEGLESDLDRFLELLRLEKPPLAQIYSLHVDEQEPTGLEDFRIVPSDASGEKEALILPDIATCRHCLEELFDPDDRRYLYPFTNCTLCGPRFTIIEDLPYDRKNTSMKVFAMCSRCLKEYEDPLDRRFHAQPNASPACGPKVALLDREGLKQAEGREAILRAAEAVRGGRILGLKGLGGYQLIVDALNEEAVLELRRRKHREEKPFAVMFPSEEVLRRYALLGPREREVLCSYQAPIVLLKKGGASLAPSVSPYNEFIGAMLPYTPLHHILMREIGGPVVCTSGNLSEEPMVIDEKEALETLSLVCDLFLVHNRDIVRPVDDSVVRVVRDQAVIIRRARGYAPMPVLASRRLPPVLAVGAHLKNTVALSRGQKVFISQHIGDMETAKSRDLFERVIEDLCRMYEVRPEWIACDAHPGYATTHYAASRGLPLIRVFHHHAHVASCMLDNGLEGEVLGVSWDGTGYGQDKTVWGGEFLVCDYLGFRRVASFRPIVLIGGERAIREPRRALLAVLYQAMGQECFSHPAVLSKFSEKELLAFRTILEKEIGTIMTSSAGRLFDAMASLVGLKDFSAFEGQPPLMLEGIAEPGVKDHYPFKVQQGAILQIDLSETFLAALSDMDRGVAPSVISGRFHNTMVEAIREVVRLLGAKRVVLSGGCFQNARLLVGTLEALEKESVEVFTHSSIPPNDGGISAGQIAIASARILEGEALDMDEALALGSLGPPTEAKKQAS